MAQGHPEDHLRARRVLPRPELVRRLQAIAPAAAARHRGRHQAPPRQVYHALPARCRRGVPARGSRCHAGDHGG
ncbi:hypothetical protein O1611_g10237 [Lasiodiplodia mahajangana]|uniref:Uncharacterized protein n=1 Tax=Lasiodiplodia mahajangana TaxID=1108764 RepID=A0ACC2J0Q9_9PEZI|nr:hypothetical protein O1611_g10237 [Lasiodiplodia mahajangana]